MVDRATRRKWTVVLLLAGALLRLLFVANHGRYSGDTLVYGDLARNMLLHHVYGFTEGAVIRSTLIRMPGYPAFLAACFALFGLEHYTAALAVQTALDLLGCYLLSRLGAWAMNERAGLWALGLACLCPFTANYCAMGLTETLTLFCVVAAFYSLARWLARARRGQPWNAWLLPLCLALLYAVLLRPDRILLASAVLPVLLVTSWQLARGQGALRRLAPTAAVLAGLALPLLLWTARNWRVYHVIQPLAPKYANDPGERVSYGFYRWYRTWGVEYKSNMDVFWTYDGEPQRMTALPPRAFDSPAQRAETERILALYNQESASTPEVEAAFAALAAERVRAHPVRSEVVMPLARFADMWLRPRTEFMPLPLDWWLWRAHPRGSALAFAYGLLNLVLLAVAAAGLWRWRRARWTGYAPVAYAMLLFLALRCGLLLVIDNSEPRYTIDCYPLLLLWAAFALSSRGEQAHDARG